jgi:hypothetical protein
VSSTQRTVWSDPPRTRTSTSGRSRRRETRASPKVVISASASADALTASPATIRISILDPPRSCRRKTPARLLRVDLCATPITVAIAGADRSLPLPPKARAAESRSSRCLRGDGSSRRRFAVSRWCTEPIRPRARCQKCRRESGIARPECYCLIISAVINGTAEFVSGHISRGPATCPPTHGAGWSSFLAGPNPGPRSASTTGVT